MKKLMKSFYLPLLKTSKRNLMMLMLREKSKLLMRGPQMGYSQDFDILKKHSWSQIHRVYRICEDAGI